MIGCRSRADVATWRRRDVETSRRGSHFLALIPIAPKLASTTALFAPKYLHPNQTPNQGSDYKNYIINIKKNVKMKDRREYSMSVLGTHQTPDKLSGSANRYAIVPTLSSTSKSLIYLGARFPRLPNLTTPLLGITFKKT